MSTVRWLPTTAQKMNQAPGTIVVGSPGAGKTFALLNICANCLGVGQRVIAIDPKNDFSKLLNVQPNIDLIDINNINPGALNPFEFLKGKNGEFVDTATIMTVIELLCGKLDRNIIIDITPIVTDFVTKSKNSGEYVDMQDVADYLYANPKEAAQQVGTMLKMFEDNKYGPLLFTRETNVEPLYLSETNSMIITLHGLALPEYTKKVEDYDASERLTSTIIYILTKKLLDILSQDNKIPITLVCDEAHLLFGNREMANIIDRFLVLGRSLNVATILASQGVSHFPDNISQYITTKFMFRSAMDEAELFLDKFDTSKLNAVNSINRTAVLSMVTNFDPGTTFMIDRNNRCGVIHIQSIYDVKLLTSNPFEKIRDEDTNSEENIENINSTKS